MLCEAMPSRLRLRRRMSAGVRGAVTFVAKRVSLRAGGTPPGAAQSPLGAPATPASSRFRKWLPAGLAAFMTVLTSLVFWSVAARVSTVLADTRDVARQIRDMEQQLHPPTNPPEEQKAREQAIGELRGREDKVQQQKTRINEKVATLDASQARQRELREQEQAERDKLEEHGRGPVGRLHQHREHHGEPDVSGACAARENDSAAGAVQPSRQPLEAARRRHFPGLADPANRDGTVMGASGVRRLRSLRSIVT